MKHESRGVGENKIRRRRQKLWMTQIQLSELAGIHVETLRKIERKEHSPSMATIKKLCVAMKCKPNELI